MLAAQYSTSGPQRGVLELVQVERPEPGPGEVLVRVAVSGVNPTDWKVRKQGGGTSAGFDRVIPHHDGAGEIVAVGPGVDAGRVGERVWTWLAQWQRAEGTAAEYVALPQAQAVRLPDGADYALGASLGIPAMTAHRCLFAAGPVEGQAVLVTGGAGAVGHAAIELARWAGARVAATVSSAEKAELAARAGADLVVNYRDDDVAEVVREWAPDGVARIVDVDIVANLDADERVLAPNGVVSSYAVSGEPATLSRQLMIANATLQFVLVYTMPDQAKRDAVSAIVASLEDGALSTLPTTRFALEDVAAAHDAVESGVTGKVLVDIPRSGTA